MKIGTATFFVFLSLACEPGRDNTMEDEDGIIGRWELVQVIAGWTGQVAPASQLGYQQYFIFNTDGTFLKTRSNGQSASGTFVTKELSDGIYLEVAFNDENSQLLESCSSMEYLRLEEENRLLGGSLPCDGPGLAYTKVRSASE